MADFYFRSDLRTRSLLTPLIGFQAKRTKCTLAASRHWRGRGCTV